MANIQNFNNSKVLNFFKIIKALVVVQKVHIVKYVFGVDISVEVTGFLEAKKNW